MTNFVITTQILENYGAHCESGRFVDGTHYWKMKGGTDYLVTGLDRVQDAVAFIAATAIENNLGYKEFPVEWKTESEWLEELEDASEDYREFLLEQLVRTSPQKAFEKELA